MNTVYLAIFAVASTLQGSDPKPPASTQSLIVTNPSTSVIIDGKWPGADPADVQVSRAIHRAAELASLGSYAQATAVLERARASVPAAKAWRLKEPLADLYFRAHRDGDAYQLLAGEIKREGPDSLVLRASLAAARAARPVPGQRKRLERYLVEMQGFPADRLKGYLPTTDSVRALEVMSLLALGRMNDGFDEPLALFYWQEAARRDPGNPIALLAEGNMHLRRGRYPQALSAFTAARRRAMGPDVALVKDGIDTAAAKVRALRAGRQG